MAGPAHTPPGRGLAQLRSADTGASHVLGSLGRPTCWPNQLWDLLESKGVIALGLEDTAADPPTVPPAPALIAARPENSHRQAGVSGSAPPLSRARSAQGSGARACPRRSDTPTGPGGRGLPQGWPRLAAGEPSAQAPPLPERGSWEPPCGWTQAARLTAAGPFSRMVSGFRGCAPPGRILCFWRPWELVLGGHSLNHQTQGEPSCSGW